MRNTSLYARGYVIGHSSALTEDFVPTQWLRHQISSFWIRHDPRLPTRQVGPHAVLFGYFYNPWSGEGADAAADRLGSYLPSGRPPDSRDEALWKLLDEAGGRFVLVSLEPGHRWAVSDAVSLQPMYYTGSGDQWVASSHSNLLGEIGGLPINPWVDELVRSRFYSIGVRHLPGLVTPFSGMHRLAANHWLNIDSGCQNRFFPREPHGHADDWGALVGECAEALRTSVEVLCADHCVSASLSIGTDSRCTLAACRGVRDKVGFFSYYADPQEKRDAIGARKLCRRLRISHELYPIDVREYAENRDVEFERVLSRNTAGVRSPKLSEVAKIKTLAERFPEGRLELKTHVSEVGRAFYCKKMSTKTPPKYLTPRDMSNLYKKNLFDRKLLRWMDMAFAEFRDFTCFGQDFFDYEEHDMFYWEHRMPQWAALANQDHDIVHGMVSIFNNRRLLANFLKPSREERIGDELHKDVIRALWPEALALPLDSGSRLKTCIRKTAERVFFLANRF